MRFEITRPHIDGTSSVDTVEDAASVAVLVREAAAVGQTLHIRPRRRQPEPAQTAIPTRPMTKTR
ncbi:hypothetical protein [Embleya sp. NBC_00896]|uniref:hypothetical protein n=1 Tax=Embleya sp. NBC_00896 TaxID=2975961 RepID=UPI002F914548|nr:hypothetical protein OG928_46250 [Embleya sp. NBC_00896]